MRLYILRHGKAKDSFPDEIRELTDKGRDDLNFVLTERLEELKAVRQIQSSALVRAEQTSEIAAKVLEFDGDVVQNAHLTPWAKPMEFIRSIDESKGDMLIASHQPFISDLVKVLTGEDVWMPTSSMACVEAEYLSPESARLLWQQNPKK